jgi:saccharopine dehydrogenase (NAD+, L-lysine forming)
MRVLLVGAGGVGTAITRIAARRPFFAHMAVADHDLARAEAASPLLLPDPTEPSRSGGRRRCPMCS